MIYIAYVGHVAVVPWYTLHLCDALCTATAPRCGANMCGVLSLGEVVVVTAKVVVCLFSVFRLNKRPKGSSRVCWSHAIHRHGLHAEAISTLHITLKPKHPMGAENCGRAVFGGLHLQFASCNCGHKGICISEAQYYCLINGRCHNAPQHEYRPRATSSQLSRMLFRFARTLGKITTRFIVLYMLF